MSPISPIHRRPTTVAHVGQITIGGDNKSGLKEKIEKANKDLADVKYEFKTN